MIYQAIIYENDVGKIHRDKAYLSNLADVNNCKISDLTYLDKIVDRLNLVIIIQILDFQLLKA